MKKPKELANLWLYKVNMKKLQTITTKNNRWLYTVRKITFSTAE